jgi:hypothetical protein
MWYGTPRSVSHGCERPQQFGQALAPDDEPAPRVPPPALSQIAHSDSPAFTTAHGAARSVADAGRPCSPLVVESAVLLVRRCIALTFVAALVSGCDAARDPTSGPHPPGNGNERAAAAEYRDFMRALERKDANVICRQLEPPLARSYRCAPGRPLRVPRALRRIEVPMRELFANVDRRSRT